MEGKWSNIQADYRKKNPNITDQDIDFKSGDFDHMIVSVAKRIGKTSNDEKMRLKIGTCKFPTVAHHRSYIRLINFGPTMKFI